MAFSKRALPCCVMLGMLVAVAALAEDRPNPDHPNPDRAIQPSTDPAVHLTHAAVISTTQTYDPQNPTHEMPAPDADEAGVTVSDFSCTAKVTGTILTQSPRGRDVQATVRVDSVEIALQLKVHEWISQNAPRKMWSHEGGHRIIAEHFYAGADATAGNIGHEMIGREFFGTGIDANTAANAALTRAASDITRRYMAEVRDPSEQVQEIYDRITNHGTNAIDELDAINQSLTEAQKTLGRSPIAENQSRDATVK
jgi:hypothetical protein